LSNILVLVIGKAHLVRDIIKYLPDDIPDHKVKKENYCTAAKKDYQEHDQNYPPNSRFISLAFFADNRKFFLVRHHILLQNSNPLIN